ncbi:MAG: D-alanine--D-alanine ligase [Clostridiales Family XIII bacterium]|jgi:D-alanine-D-alanine ligase|nr:D-alanine--D-alanine ligase [Clostridiales Family XIII bacterium]
MKKIGILFGGKSGEHDVSVLSAASVLSAIDRRLYEVLPIGINRKGEWFLIDADMKDLVSFSDPRFSSIIPETRNDLGSSRALHFGEIPGMIDFAFPLLHGPFGEDGTIQGMFEMMDIPYAGCGVSASAVTMDKIFTKELLIRAGLPVCKHVAFAAFSYDHNPDAVLAEIEEELPYPLFVKPANMGSSVGISQAADRVALIAAIQMALQYDRRVLVEETITGRELETAILGNENPLASVVGEIFTTNSFYDYDAKYKNQNATKIEIPAKIPQLVADRICEAAVETYKTLDATGFSRVDFFWDEKTDKIYVNEINTIPGFTKYSMFPLLWREKGLAYPDLIERIIELGYERYSLKNHR